MIRINLLLPILIFAVSTSLLAGCRSSATQNAQSPSSERQATLQAQDFFEQHPEYTSSKEKESLLFAEFQEVTKEPAYKNMSMYQLLLIAHDRLQR